MREIVKTISVPVDGKPLDFRLTKLDAFSGVVLLRMLSKAEQGDGPQWHLVKPRELTQLSTTSIS